MAELNLDEFLAVVNYPKIKASDHQWIDDFRKLNDDYYDLMDTHFTFVFPTFNVEKEKFIDEVKKQAEGIQKFNFRIKCAIRNNDRVLECFHVLLVPDQGFSEIVKLHDKLYSGLFKPYERLDLDFIPHMGIANSKDPKECKRMVDEVNAMEIDVFGTIDQLDIIEYKDKRISTIEGVKLTG
jgi:2'-5' RNA ligase